MSLDIRQKIIYNLVFNIIVYYGISKNNKFVRQYTKSTKQIYDKN